MTKPTGRPRGRPKTKEYETLMCRVDTALDQGRNRESKGDRKADIAGVEEGRMEGECRVLQDGIEAVAFDGCGIEPQERIGGGDDEEEEGRTDQALNGEHPRFELERQIGAEARDRGAEDRQDQHP